ncbi:MAG: hypothetical protein OHK0023_03350 [Anaerolineae bacterium]
MLEAFGTLNSIAFMAVVTAMSPKAALAFLAIEVGQHLDRGDVGGAALSVALFFIFPQGDELADLRLSARQLTIFANSDELARLVTSGLADEALLGRARTAIDDLFAAMRNKLGTQISGDDFSALLRTLDENQLRRVVDNPNFFDNLPLGSSWETVEFYVRTWDYNGSCRLFTEGGKNANELANSVNNAATTDPTKWNWRKAETGEAMPSTA